MQILSKTCAQLWLCAVFFVSAPQLCGDEVFDALWGEIEAQVLWEDPEWWTLGHYHRTLWGRISSRMDDPAFFLHPKGKHNRKLELQATLQAFLNPASEQGEPTPACRFPARRRWLLERLEMPDETFPGGDCEAFLKNLETLQIESATLIYPSAYLNSPASMFGHLLLVLERKGKDRLLSRAVNYAATDVNDRFGPLFAFKGIFGLYQGVYTILPYYDKVEEYAAVNRRDIWEYPLEFTEDELDMLLRHVWELQGMQSRYFFFKENCAFNLLYPLQVARPSLQLVNRFRASAVPVSLLQQISRSGLPAEPVYRASKESEMAHLASQLRPEQLTHVQAVVAGQELNGEESAAELSLIIAWIQYRYTEQQLTPEAYREQIFPLLRKRSQMGRTENPEVPAPYPPESGHAPRRLGLYGGLDTDTGDPVAGVKLRAAYHDWLDNPKGYPPGSSIRMFALDVQGRPEDGELYLNDLTLMDVRSQTPPEPWVRPLSWVVAFGGEAAPFDPQHLRGYVRVASGFTRRAGDKGQAYLMFTQQVIWDTNLKSNLSWEPGVEWGLTRSGMQYAAGLRGWHNWGVLGYDGDRHKVELECRRFLGQDFALGLSSVFRYEKGDRQNLLSLNVYRTF